MLDDLKYIHARDSLDSLGWAAKEWQQLRPQFVTPQKRSNPDAIVYAGAGSLAIAGLICQSWLDCSRPFNVVQDNALPAYVSSKTLCIGLSYSGNDEQVLSVLRAAALAGAEIVIITSGGELAALARQKNYRVILLPKLAVSRFGVLYSLNALVQLLEATGLLGHDSKAADQLSAASPKLQDAVSSWLPSVPTKSNAAKRLALDIIGKSAIIYSGPLLMPAAANWKLGFNETAKQLAWAVRYPDATLAELLGWTGQPVHKPYAVIDLVSSFDNPAIQKQFEVSKRLLSGRRPEPSRIVAKGETAIEQLLWTLIFGDFVTIYTALANGVDPISAEPLDKFKKMLEG